jgi:hypothetical protein
MHYPNISDEDWRVFTEGTEVEQDAWRTRAFGDDEDADGTERAGTNEQ